MPRSTFSNDPFPARYPGICTECRGLIAKGQAVRYVDNLLVHGFHAKEKPAPCPTCWMVGPCECDDEV